MGRGERQLTLQTCAKTHSNTQTSGSKSRLLASEERKEHSDSWHEELMGGEWRNRKLRSELAGRCLEFSGDLDLCYVFGLYLKTKPAEDQEWQ